jgi:hypothetical protein
MRGTTLEQRREAIRRTEERVRDPGRTEQLRPRALEQIAPMTRPLGQFSMVC